MLDNIRENSTKFRKTLEATKLLDETDLQHLYELHRLYNEALVLAAELMASALYMKDMAYNERKQKQEELMLNEDGKIAEREAKAELAIKELSEQAAQGNYTYTRNQALSHSLDHKVYDVKAKRSAMKRELQGG